MEQEQPKLKGAVRAIDLATDGDRPGSFAVTIGIQIRTDGRVGYDEAERLAAKYRREYLGKEVEFLAVSIPCPVCGKILNSEAGLKLHVRQSHPERTDLYTATKPEPKKTQKKNGEKKSAVKAEKNGKAMAVKPRSRANKVPSISKKKAEKSKPEKSARRNPEKAALNRKKKPPAREPKTKVVEAAKPKGQQLKLT